MKVFKKAVLVLMLLSCGLAFAAPKSKGKSKRAKTSPFYAKLEVGFEGGNLVDDEIDTTYTTFGVIKPTFGWAAIEDLPNLAFEAYLKLAFSNFYAKEGDFKEETSDFIVTPAVGASYTFNPGDPWMFFAGAALELPIETFDTSFSDSETSVGFNLAVNGGIRGKIDNSNEALAALNFSVISHNSWGLTAGFLHRF